MIPENFSTTRKQALQAVALTLLFPKQTAQAQRLVASARNTEGVQLQALLNTPEKDIDFAKAKITIDRMIDPSIDEAQVMAQIDVMIKQINGFLPSTRRTSSVQKVEAILHYLHDPGIWNEHRVFKYDLENDPTGTKNFNAKLLANYIRTRLGNCISMPILFVILAQKMEVDATLSKAPFHVFAKFRDDKGVLHNVEATTGGPKLTASYQREFGIAQVAINNGVYLHDSTKKQAVVIMANTLLEFYSIKNDDAKLSQISDVLLQADPSAAEVMIFKGSSFNYAMHKRLKKKYNRFEDIPANLKPEAIALMKQRDFWYDKALALGWKPETEAAKQAYMKMVNGAKQQVR